jgi:hypothetical protein
MKKLLMMSQLKLQCPGPVDDETDETMFDLERMECRDTQISCIAARVWQSHPRHADLKKVSSM